MAGAYGGRRNAPRVAHQHKAQAGTYSQGGA
nr:MAG TPA: hypothetical protein [Caudoviricetes sp.]